MIPEFDEDGNLPPGVHEAMWDEVAGRFGTSPRRLTLLAGLKAALESLQAAGCRRAYIDGSFVTARDEPQDFDACWEASGVDPAALDPTLLDFSDARAAQKAKFQGELFPAEAAADPDGTRFLDYFQHDKDTGRPKGMIVLDLGDIP